MMSNTTDPLSLHATTQCRNDRSCVQFRDWTGGRVLSTVGTNAGAKPLPFQTWRRFKEAFAPELVERANSEARTEVKHIADPFGGSGTTALAAQFLGIESTTIEVNPYLADLIEAKIAPIDFNLTGEILRRVVDHVSAGSSCANPVFHGAPRTFVEPGVNGRYIFSREIAGRFLAYRTAIEQVDDPAHRRLFRVVLASTAVPSSNVVVSGKGRRYRMRWKERENSPQIVDSLFREGTRQVLHDLRKFACRLCPGYRILRGDARRLADKIGPFDLAVFSPPYPNSFDYTDVYNVELWAMGYLENRDANARLRHATVNSHVQLIRPLSKHPVQSATLSQTINALSAVRSKLWSRHIPEMIGSYARDMATVLEKLATGLRAQGRLYMVVGDSRYAGITVPVGTIMSEVGQSLGYELVHTEPSRSMRSSPQQGGVHELIETLIVMQRR